MTEGEALDRLCTLCAIAPEFTDIWGKVHHVSPTTAQVLLAAMGIDITAAPVEQWLAQEESRVWRRWLQSVQVVRDSSAPIEVTLRLAEAEATKSHRWRVTLEDGMSHEGEVYPADLDVTERAEIEGKSFAAYRFDLPLQPGLGYHRFEIFGDAGRAAMSLVVAPPSCYLPQAVSGSGRVWGPALQLYALRSRRNWGMGDFTDLRWALEHFAEQGAGVIGLNPLHALFPHNPSHASPYSPSSRLFLNVLYLDIEAVPEFTECAVAQQTAYAREFQKELHLLRAADMVDYKGVAQIKFPVLELLYEYFREHHLARGSERARAFQAFQKEGGELLQRHSLYEALQEHFYRRDPDIWGWPVWPEAYRDPAAQAVREFAQREAARLEFYQYLQWQADQQLGAVARRSAALGLGVGLYQDLAISVDPAGAEVWALQSLYARGVGVGSPPDDFNMKGQNWGIPPLVPQRLTDAAYAPFIATLRENMRHAGALRIDHVMGLMRLYWVPQDLTAEDGAYVRYPFADMLGILALESHRNQCMVIGEDLGTVPDEVRAALAPMQILSYRVFYFECDRDGNLNPPGAYPVAALATVSTHDLPTLGGYWKGQDLIERFELRLFPSEQAYRGQILARTQDRARLLIALEREGLLPPGLTVDPASSPEMTPELACAIHQYVARTPAKIMMLQLEDVIGQLWQVNLPATSDERPNWRIKLEHDLEDVITDPRTRVLFSNLRELRGSGVVAPAMRAAHPVAVIPRATYRLQFNRGFTFAHAAKLVPYLARLGISHIYASPFLKARPGSLHGYDIVDHNSLNLEIGTEADYELLAEALQHHAMGQIVDIVPNHMGIGSDNAWWLDVMENGQGSLYADYFDIDWRPIKEELRGKVLLPVLGDHYGSVLEAGAFKLEFDTASGAYAVRYYQHYFPIDPKTYPLVLEQHLTHLETSLGAEHARYLELQSLIAALRHLPARTEVTQDKLIERHRDKEVHKQRLAELFAAVPEIRQHVEQAVSLYNGSEGLPARFDLMHALLEQQAYRLAFWRVAADEINYRRFFDINDLAGLRMENPQAFFATHRLISKLVAQGKVDGLRIDHPDGLYDPVAYFQRLQGFVTAAVGAAPATEVAGSTAAGGLSLYVISEKILASYEHLPQSWPIHGTTGYDFANQVNAVLIDPSTERELDRYYARFIGKTFDFDDLLHERKKLIMRVALSSELTVLANQINRISESSWQARDFTLTALRAALTEVVAYFPVYRTYVTGGHVTSEDRRYIDWAVGLAKKRNPAADVSIFDFIRSVLLLEGIERRPEAYRRACTDFTMRFQQYTAPVMAKGLEDTSFYIYNRLVSLNEVGGDPRRFGISIGAFHHANSERARHWPHTMLCTSTHDSKRSEDVRARIDVLTELAAEWRTRSTRWRQLNRTKKSKINGDVMPDRNDEYLLYQTLIGAWPCADMDDTELAQFCDRIESYMLKAVREAKVHTSWIKLNTEYEEAMTNFVRSLLAPGRNIFLDDFVPFQKRVSRFGMLNSLSQALLKLTSPGVPDLYQGSELWDFSLVDPDNRRPVNYARRAELLDELERWDHAPPDERGALVRMLSDIVDDGRAKLYLTWKTLGLRAARPDVFQHGEYTALVVEGPRADHLCAYARAYHDSVIVVVSARWYARLENETGASAPADYWNECRVQAPDVKVWNYRNLFTGAVEEPRQEGDKLWFAVSEMLADFPVAVLASSPPEAASR